MRLFISIIFTSLLFSLPQAFSADPPSLAPTLLREQGKEEATALAEMVGEGLIKGAAKGIKSEMDDPANPRKESKIAEIVRDFSVKMRDNLSKSAEEFRKTIGNNANKVGDTIRSYGTDKIAKYGVALAGGLTLIATASFFAKKWWEQHVKTLYKPKLKLEKGVGNGDASKYKVFLNPESDAELQEAIATLTGSHHQSELPNLLFYGPPGTGKTLKARQMASNYHFDYIICSGSNWFRVPTDQAIEEIDKMFNTVEKPQNKTMIFIDEADSLLMSRNDLSPEQSKVVTHFLTKTGDLSPNYFFVFATNRADKIDPAMISRITYMVRFDLPDMSTREKLLDQYLLDAIASVPNIVKAEQLKQWVKRNIKSWASLSDGFSGRDIKSIAVRLKWKLLSAKNPVSEDLDGFMLKVFDNVRIKQSDLPDDVKKSNAIPAMAAAAA
jgi:hypothetical protein